jgi:hypothetical protein
VLPHLLQPLALPLRPLKKLSTKIKCLSYFRPFGANT